MSNRKLWMRLTAAAMSAMLILPASAVRAWGGVF